ncbi:hypothetical protein [Jiella avicenniae]|uniref:Uncharacterized protein n=1 Tax=Jiella avicenniae TaxID=2907202 RepID=A0A9X1P019_9HYPH|nr:hypothetical protein [Jiella avicenniae]MCE7026868.1 hypothetical protein [Jiella avicenniae]
MASPASGRGSRWIPPKRIRPIAIGLCVEDRHVLLMEVLDAEGRLVGHRPPGGGIEFMESAEAAVTRELERPLCVQSDAQRTL